MKAEIYNLIILDESGSMDCVRRQTISGCNETLNVIRANQKKYEDTQTHYVSIYAFQSGCAPSRFIVKNAPALSVDQISERDYCPGGCTPLYDAVGMTLSDLKAKIETREMAVGHVTIITDGYENASHEYTMQKVAAMIDELKSKGWTFSFIGANIDVKQVSSSLNIDNCMEFQQDDEGTSQMFARESHARSLWSDRINTRIKCCHAPTEENLQEIFKEESGDYFNDVDEARDDAKDKK